MKELLEAVEKFELAMPPIKKNKNAQVGQRKYKYAQLDAIYKVAKPILKDCGLKDLNWTKGGKVHVRIYHKKSDAFIGSSHRIPKIKSGNPNQNIGISITYLTRYLFCQLLSIIPHDDVDGLTSTRPQIATKPGLSRYKLNGQVTKRWADMEALISGGKITQLTQVVGKYQVSEADQVTIMNLIKQA